MKKSHLRVRTKNTRDRNSMWQVIREMKTFTRRDIMKRTDHQVDSVITFLDALISGGYVQELPARTSNPRETRQYLLIRDAGIICPKLDESGKRLPPSERQRMWKALKVIGKSPFDWRDLSYVAKTKVTVTKEYCTFLHRGTYLRIVRESIPGTPTKYLFQAHKDTGPLAPELRKRKTELHDMNTRQIVWKKDHVLARDMKTRKLVWVKQGGGDE